MQNTGNRNCFVIHHIHEDFYRAMLVELNATRLSKFAELAYFVLYKHIARYNGLQD